jgi:hypothetical protein
MPFGAPRQSQRICIHLVPMAEARRSIGVAVQHKAFYSAQAQSKCSKIVPAFWGVGRYNTDAVLWAFPP